MFRREKENTSFRNVAGAVLMQALLGLAVMVAMSPVVFDQIRKYNEDINQEEVMAQMTLLQKAVVSYISFDKKGVPNGCNVLSGKPMVDVLVDYGGEHLPTSNAFGQEYYFLTCKVANQTVGENEKVVEAVVFASGEMDDLVLNGIGQYLFDQGGVIANRNVELEAELGKSRWRSNYDTVLSKKLIEEIENIIGDNGALVMFVSDTFFFSDYLYIHSMGTATDFNTMLVDLNMNDNNLQNVSRAEGTKLIISRELHTSGLAGVNIVFNKSKLEDNSVLSLENKDREPFVGSTISVYPQKVKIYEMEVDNAEFKSINLDSGDFETDVLEAQKITVHGNLTIVDNESWKFGASEVEAFSLTSLGPVSNDFGVVNMKDDEDGLESFIYSGVFNIDGYYDDDKSSKINLSGMSEVVDVCSETGCISEQVFKIYDDILVLWDSYGQIEIKEE